MLVKVALIASLLSFLIGGYLTAPAVGRAGIAIPTQCLDLTGHSDLDTKKIVAGLGLTGDQLRAVRMRLAGYYSVRGFSGLDGLGLTATQTAEIQRRIAQQVAGNHQPGWPCAPFTNPTKVIAYMRQTLVANGFRAASIQFFRVLPRQIQFRGIQDGVQLGGAIVKRAVRQIDVSLQAPGFGKRYTFRLAFAA